MKEMKKEKVTISGATYQYKDEIKSAGGTWLKEKRAWIVDKEDFEKELKSIFDEYNAELPEVSGQLWEECPKCGKEFVYMSLGGYCDRCRNAERIIYKSL